MVGDKRPFWLDASSDDAGFSSVGVAIALLIALSLVFTGAQVYRVQSASAEIQELADVSALAADNVVAEYYLVARVCDAVVLSLTLTGVIALGMGVAALCTPLAASVGKTLIQAGEKTLKARDAFARKATVGLSKLQKLLPFLAAAAACQVAAANRGPQGSRYIALALAFPFEGEEVESGAAHPSDELIDAVEGVSDDLQEAGEQAERAAKQAKEAKERAFQADCGANPSYCLYERAATLSDLQGAQNPYFGSAETWGFSIALERAKAYYHRRLALEAPDGPSWDEQADSALRARFYRFAIDLLERAYVRESGDGFEAEFPLLPRNTSELRETPLFTEAVYPVSVNGSGASEMHAWDGCPHAATATVRASLAEWEAGDYAICPICHFSASSLGRVASASSSIENGFEYHYRIIAECAREYEKARKGYGPKARKVRRIAGSLFQDILSALRSMAGQRIKVAPPGRFGVVVIAASVGPVDAQGALSSAFVDDVGGLGTRVALSAATLASDTPEQGRTVIASALDGVRERSDSLGVGIIDGLLDVWSAVLFAYADGQARIGQGIDELDSRLSFGSESRLGLWSSGEFAKLMESLGLEPAELDAPKPVLVNSFHVLQADGGPVSARLLGVKRVASQLSGHSLFESLVNTLEGRALDSLESLDGRITVAEIEIAGAGLPSVPLTITLPDSVKGQASTLVSDLAAWLRNLEGSVTGVRQWR